MLDSINNNVVIYSVVGWIKMPLFGTKVGLGLGYIVLDWAQQPPLFGPCLAIVAKRSTISATAELLMFNQRSFPE